ncbi:hypothetical protein E2986_13695 [Frieseomelitta varia]|uniref:Uncharacterized protein n=1 Tax=Frieseomelitta varia TaxID=561572 RepID=A0A833RNJ5_9HYME|nr:hypothetical protein E2986_13695 [Frieseomelitta varia]
MVECDTEILVRKISITRSHHEEVTTHETRPGPNPNHPPLHSNCTRHSEGMPRFYSTWPEERRQMFHSSVSNLGLNLNSKAHV